MTHDSEPVGAAGDHLAVFEGKGHPVDEVLKPGPMFVYGLQHVMSMYAGVVAVPLIVGSATEAAVLRPVVPAGRHPADLRSGDPVADPGCAVDRRETADRAGHLVRRCRFHDRHRRRRGRRYGGSAGHLRRHSDRRRRRVPLSGVFCRLLRFFPPVVTGSVITVIGISLLPVAMKWAGGGVGTEDFGSLSNIGLAAITLGIILLIYRFLPGFFSRIAILIGLLAGGVVAAILGKVNFSPVSEAQGFAISTPFHFGAPTFEVAAIVSMIIVMLVIMTETTADLLAIGVVVGRPADRKTVANGLRADTLSTAVSGGLLNGFPVSAFAQNVGLVALTGIKSRFVVAVSGGILLVLGLFPKVGAIVAALAVAGAGRCRVGVVRHASPPAVSAACPRCTTRATRTWSSSRCRSAWASSRSLCRTSTMSSRAGSRPSSIPVSVRPRSPRCC